MLRTAIATLLALSALAAGGPSPAAAQAPIDLADLFLVEQDGGWFCGANGEQINGATCPQHGSEWFSRHFLDRLKGKNHPKLFLRVGKARNDCDLGQPLGRDTCTTGVPEWAACPDAPDKPTPYC